MIFLLDSVLLGIIGSVPTILSGLADIFGGLILLVIGVLVIILVVAAAIILLPAIIVGAIIWFLTGSLFYAGIAFLVIALISAVAMAD